MDNSPELSVIILNYKTDQMVIDLIGGLIPDPRMEILVVDNSPENTLESKLSRRSDLSCFYTGSNSGYSGGNNYGIEKARGEWILILNSDTKTNTSDLLKLLEITKKNPVLVSTPRLIQPDGVIQDNVGFLDPIYINPTNAIFARPRFIKAEEIKENIFVDCLTGAAMLVHKTVFEKIGLLDDKKFFMYFEDMDFSQRLKRAGIKVLYIPSVSIIHYGGASSDQDSRQKNINYQNGLKTYLKKHRGRFITFINEKLHLLS